MPRQLKIFTKFTTLPLFKLGTSDRLIFCFKEFSFIVICCTLLMNIVCIREQVTPRSIRGVFLIFDPHRTKTSEKESQKTTETFVVTLKNLTFFLFLRHGDAVITAEDANSVF